jgi:hypothetical protein
MTIATPEDMAANHLLAILMEHDLGRLAPHLHAFEFEGGHVLQQAGEPVVNTWFPCGQALASFCVTAASGDNVEVAIIGCEGAIGGIVSNGEMPAYATALVRSKGLFIRIKTTALEQAKIDSVTLRHWFSRYSDCLLAQVFQTAACNARHSITQRTCKWLLAAAERTKSTQITMTQEDLAGLLGVGRTFVNRTLRKLRDQGLVEARRGKLILKDEVGLRKTACNCNAAIENHFDEVLHGIYPTI